MPPSAAGTPVRVERPDEARISELNVRAWPIWSKGPSTFDWEYDEPEVCFFLEGEVTVRTPQGPVAIRAGDLVTFPQGLRCTWTIHTAVRKHYRFG